MTRVFTRKSQSASCIRAARTQVERCATRGERAEREERERERQRLSPRLLGRRARNANRRERQQHGNTLLSLLLLLFLVTHTHKLLFQVRAGSCIAS